MTFEWQQGERVRRLELRATGDVFLDRGHDPIARIVGACVLSATGAVLAAVEPAGTIRTADPAEKARFEKRPALRDEDGRPVPVGEVLVAPRRLSGGALAIADDGSVWIAAEPAFTLPAADVTHYAPRYRRTALLLEYLGPELAGGRAAPAEPGDERGD